MRLKFVFAALVTQLASIVVAAPSRSTREEPGHVHVFYCTDINWSGDCYNMPVVEGGCYNMTPEFTDGIPSLGPDVNVECDIFLETNCVGYNYWIENPGIADLRTIGTGVLNDATKSISCRRSWA